MQERNKKERTSSVGLCQKHKPQHPHHMKVSPWGPAVVVVVIVVVVVAVVVVVNKPLARSGRLPMMQRGNGRG